ncbi:MAG: hypothetical protein ACREBE_19265 [bacterium]
MIVWLIGSVVFSSCGAGEQSALPAAAPAVDEQLEVVVPAIVDALQSKQAEFVMSHVGSSFAEERGLDYFDVRSLVESYTLRDESLGARLESVALTPLSADTQRVEARVTFTRGQQLAEGVAPPAGAVTYAFDLVFAKRAGVWQARSGSYRRE